MADLKDIVLKFVSKQSFNVKKRKQTWEKFYTYLENGLSMKNILEITESRAKRDKSPLAAVFSNILKKYNAGKSFAEAVADYVSPEEYILFVSGENKAETFQDTFKLAIELLEVKEKLQQKIIGELSYPVILMLVNIFILYGAGKYIIPEFALTSDPAKWEGAGAFLYTVSLFINSPWFILVLFLIFLLLSLVIISLPRWTGRFRLYAENFPPYNSYKEIVGSIWIYTLATLIKSGLTVTESLHELAKSSNISNYLFERIKKIIKMHKKGGLLSEALRHTKMDFPSKDIIENLEVYEKYPNFHEQLYKLGKQWLSDTEKKLVLQLKVVRFIFLGMVFANVGIMVMALFSIQNSML